MNPEAGPKACFVDCMCRHYHAEREQPSGGVVASELATSLYDLFRSPMQHCLGLALDRPKKGVRRRLELTHELMVFRDRESLSEPDVVLMESGEWPPFLSRPTLQYDSGQLVLAVEAFYVGTRRLISSVLADKDVMQLAEKALADWLHVGNEAIVADTSAVAQAQTTGAVSSGTTHTYTTTLSKLYRK